MNIKYNNLANPTNLVTFSNIPNILSVTDNVDGIRASITLTFQGNLREQTTENSQWYISILGDSISSVITPDMAVSKNFYATSANTSMAASVCRALRACPTIAAQFNVRNINNTVSLTAKAIGHILTTDWYSTNIPSTYLTNTYSDGSATSTLYNSKIDVDIYSNNNYITTLEKNYYNGEVAFDLSPVLSTISQKGKTVPYSLSVTKIGSDGLFSTLAYITGNYATVGYMVNQGNPYLQLTSGVTIAQNAERGSYKTSYNNSILYVYENSIPLSVYTLGSDAVSYEIIYKDSSFTDISSTGYTVSVPANNKLVQIEAPITLPNDCFYVDLVVGGLAIRYNVIKPLNASYGCQRLHFINSYGGWSFIDLTGQRTEEKSFEYSTYNKNNFDYYKEEIHEKEKIYDNSVKYSITCKSHLMEKDGTWIYNDLIQSPYVWTTINGEDYAVILESVSVEEINNQNVYEATVKFHLSQPTSF